MGADIIQDRHLTIKVSLEAQLACRLALCTPEQVGMHNKIIKSIQMTKKEPDRDDLIGLVRLTQRTIRANEKDAKP